ncbi:hypothetical protein C5B86_10090 [Haloferax sp. Atlit-19N]|nr:hypothetical protein C5B86_10090 [Haloferax sp. Atlit-19N]
MSMLLVAMILVSTLAPFVGVATAAPSGLVGVPDANVSEDFPVGTNPPLRAADLEGSVMASDHAESLEVIATTPGRASGYVNGTTVGGGEVVLVLRDDVHSTGRTVAIDAGAVRDALGYTPERIYGTHDDGSEWSSPVRYDAGLLLFDVAHFSSNVVTFSGDISVNAFGATNGSTISYSVNSVDAVSNFTALVEGSRSTETESETFSVEGGSSAAISFASDLADSASITATPVARVFNKGGYHLSGGETATKTLDVSDVSYLEKVRVDVQDTGSDIGSSVEVRLEEADGTVITTTGTTLSAGYSGSTQTRYFDTDVSAYDSVNIVFDFNDYQSGETADGDNIRVDTGTSTDAMTITADGDGGSFSVGSTTTQQSGSIELSPSTSTISASGSGKLDVTINYTEVSLTRNPTIIINNHSTGFTGTLSEGQTANLSVNESWVQSGENNIGFRVGNGSVSDDAPTPSVNLSLAHTAHDQQSVSYESSKWRESYNVTKTFTGDQTGVTLSIPFAGNVAQIRSIEKRHNSGSWSTVTPADYDFDGTSLVVDMGSVSGGDSVSLRARGQRLVVSNGSLTVTDPTPLGERLDSEVRLDSWANDSYLSLGGSPDETRLHYTYNESFGDSEYDEVTATGYHRLHLPEASASSTFRVSTVPVRVDVATGEARFRVTEPSTTEPKISVMPGEHFGDGVSFEFLAPSAGDTYLLYSTTKGTQRDSVLAGETVSLVDDDSKEILHIRKSASTESESSGSGFFGSGGGSVTDVANDYVPAMPVLNPGLVAALVLVIVAGAVAYTERRTSSTRSKPVYERPLVLLALVVAAFIGILLISPESITGPVKSALDTALPLASVLGVMLAVGGLGYWWYTRRQTRIAEAKAPENVFRIGGDDK